MTKGAVIVFALSALVRKRLRLISLCSFKTCFLPFPPLHILYRPSSSTAPLPLCRSLIIYAAVLSIELVREKWES